MNLLTFVFAISTLTATSVDWLQFGGPNRDFAVRTNNGLKHANFSKTREKWVARLGNGNSGILVQGTTVFTCFGEGGEEHIVALSISDGTIKWKKSFVVENTELLDLEFGAGPHSTPLINQDSLFFVGVTGRLVALDTKDGSLIWQKELWSNNQATRLERGFSASPVAYQHTIIVPVGGRQQSIQCFCMRTGKLQWQTHDFESAYGSPLIARLGGRDQLIVSMEQDLVGLDPITGALLWSHPTPSANFSICSSPIVSEDSVVFVNTGEGVQALEVRGSDGTFVVKRLWISRIRFSQTSNFILFDNMLYGSKVGGIFVAIDAKTGATIWQSRRIRGCSLVHAGGYLIAVEENGRVCLAVFGDNDLDIQWESQPLTGRCWVGPAVNDQLILVRDNSKMIALEFQR